MSLPSGTVTFLFTDIEGSTKLWEEHPDAMRQALARHDALLRHAIESNEGVVFKTVGDAFCAAFAIPSEALNAATRPITSITVTSRHIAKTAIQRSPVRPICQVVVIDP